MNTRGKGNESGGDMAALREKAGDIGEDLRDMASLAADAGRGQVKKIRDAANERYDDAKEQVYNWEEMLEACVREKPLKSLLFAALAGMIIAKFWRRS